MPFAAIGLRPFIVLAELGLVVLLAWRLPGIIRWIKAHGDSPLYSFSAAVEKRVGTHMLLKILAYEIVMFYYAFASWKKQAPAGESYFSLHQKSSLIAFYIMLIHAVVIETVGIHWLIHEVSPLLSLLLLLLNIYTVIYFIGEIQAVRLNPLLVKNEQIFVSLGLGKRMIIPLKEIERIRWGKEAAEFNMKSKETITFIAKDFEDVPPNCIVEFKKPLEASLFYGFKKSYKQAAIRLDEPERFKSLFS